MTAFLQFQNPNGFTAIAWQQVDAQAYNPDIVFPLFRSSGLFSWIHLVESLETDLAHLCRMFAQGQVDGQLLLCQSPKTDFALDEWLTEALWPDPVPERIVTYSSIPPELWPALLMSAQACIVLVASTPVIWQTLALEKQLIGPHTLGLPTEVTWMYEPETLLDCLKQSQQIPKTGLRSFLLQWVEQQIQNTWQQAQQCYSNQDYQTAATLCKQVFDKIRFTLPQIHQIEAIFQHAQVTDPVLWRILAESKAYFKQQAQQTVFQPIGSQERSDVIYGEAFRRCFEYLVGVGLTGDILEFGTFQGYTARWIARLMNEFRYPGHFATFDSFTGFPGISAITDSTSYEVSQRHLWQSGAFAVHGDMPQLILKGLQQLLPAHQVKVVQGFFQDTLAYHLPKHPVALLHLDCDLYESTYYVLDTLLRHHLLQDGTVLMFDDYNCNRANPGMGQRRALHEIGSTQQRFITSSFFQYGWSGHAFFVHDSVQFNRASQNAPENG